MVGTIADTGQVVATEFREGNTAPAKDNLAFIQFCEQSLPAGVELGQVRIDAAGYQRRGIEYCQQRDLGFALRAQMGSEIQPWIDSRSESEWEPRRLRGGKWSEKEQVYLGVHLMHDMEEAFLLVIQRQRKAPSLAEAAAAPAQGEMELGNLVCQEPVDPLQEGGAEGGERVESTESIYRAIATHRRDLDASGIVQWYHPRGEHSENRIKELQRDFGGQHLPCSDFAAHALYFALCAGAMNLFLWLRFHLPLPYEAARIGTVRLRLDALAVKLVFPARQLTFKLQKEHFARFQQALSWVQRGLPQPP